MIEKAVELAFHSQTRPNDCPVGPHLSHQGLKGEA